MSDNKPFLKRFLRSIFVSVSKHPVSYLFILIMISVLALPIMSEIFGVAEANRFKLLALFNDNIGIVIALSAAILSVGSLLSYVNKGIGGGRDNTKELFAFTELKNELQTLKVNVEQLSQRGVSESNSVDLKSDEKARLIEAVKKRIVGNTILAANISLKNDINSFRNQVDINKHYTDIVYRLENEIDRLNRRGGVNLVIGAVIAFVGILYLGVTVTNQIFIEDKLDYVIHMAPKLSFVIVIELFAYFFLKLYKNGFDEVKYFQNELTNIDSKVLGIKFLKDIRNEELMGEVIKNLMATERNFILEKGQSTVSLEQKKLKIEEDKKVTDIIKEFVNLRK